jgi:hypothetical protein
MKKALLILGLFLMFGLTKAQEVNSFSFVNFSATDTFTISKADNVCSLAVFPVASTDTVIVWGNGKTYTDGHIASGDTILYDRVLNIGDGKLPINYLFLDIRGSATVITQSVTKR